MSQMIVKSNKQQQQMPEHDQASAASPGDLPESRTPAAGRPDPEVVPQAKRRRFTTAYKLQILREADACTEPGQLGALLRREGLYSSYLAEWRRARHQGLLAEGAAPKRGRPANVVDEQQAELVRLQQENQQLQLRLQQAELIIDVQKKLSQLLGLNPSLAQNGDDK